MYFYSLDSHTTIYFSFATWRYESFAAFRMPITEYFWLSFSMLKIWLVCWFYYYCCYYCYYYCYACFYWRFSEFIYHYLSISYCLFIAAAIFGALAGGSRRHASAAAAALSAAALHYRRCREPPAGGAGRFSRHAFRRQLSWRRAAALFMACCCSFSARCRLPPFIFAAGSPAKPAIVTPDGQLSVKPAFRLPIIYIHYCHC